VKSPGYFDKVIDMGRYNSIMPKTVIHVSEAEAARDFAGIVARVRAGAEVVIDGGEPILVMRAGPVRGRMISECIASAKAHEEVSGKVPALDPDFAVDVEEIVNSRKSWNPPAWE
jgi:hypothetical protein